MTEQAGGRTRSRAEELASVGQSPEGALESSFHLKATGLNYGRRDLYPPVWVKGRGFF